MPVPVLDPDLSIGKIAGENSGLSGDDQKNAGHNGPAFDRKSDTQVKVLKMDWLIKRVSISKLRSCLIF